MKKIIIYLLTLACLLSLEGCTLNKDETKKDNNETKEETKKEENLGYVEKNTIEVLVHTYNDVIVDNSGLGPASEESLSIHDGKYYYTFEEDLYLIVTPVGKQNKIDEDIVDQMSISFIESSDGTNIQADAYARLLIEANNGEITADEQDTLIADAVAGKDANNGKGITVKKVKYNDHSEYQIIRNYK